jgi:hypothetical protein
VELQEKEAPSRVQVGAEVAPWTMKSISSEVLDEGVAGGFAIWTLGPLAATALTALTDPKAQKQTTAKVLSIKVLCRRWVSMRLDGQCNDLSWSFLRARAFMFQVGAASRTDLAI